MASILSDLLKIEEKELINNIELYNTEYTRENTNEKSSFSDVVYRYKNIIIIIEMNRKYRNRDIYKNHFYLMFNQIRDSYNRNNYNKDLITYLIDIDNFDIAKKLGLNITSRFIYDSGLKINDTMTIIYSNIKTIRINLDNLKKKTYNYNMLTNIERKCLIFIEKNFKILRNETKNKYIKGVIEMYKIIERDGRLYTIFDKEKYDELIMEDMKLEAREIGLKEGKKEGIKEGIKEGKIEEKINIAKKLYKRDFSIQEIIDITKLSEEQIKEHVIKPC